MRVGFVLDDGPDVGDGIARLVAVEDVRADLRGPVGVDDAAGGGVDLLDDRLRNSDQSRYRFARYVREIDHLHKPLKDRDGTGR